MNGLSALSARVERVLACAAVLVLLASPAASQPVRVGVRAGPTFGFLNDSAIPFIRTGEDAATNTNVRIDGHVGAYAVVPMTKRIGLQTELLYVRKGGHVSRPLEDSYRVEQYQLAYLEGQVLGRRAISVPGPLSLHALAGLTLERLLGGHVHRDVHTPERVLQQKIDLQKQALVRRWDVGGLVGLGLGYPIGKNGRLALELRYNPGFRSIFTEAARPSSEQPDAFADPPPLTRVPPRLRHDVITASFAYTIPF